MPAPKKVGISFLGNLLTKENLLYSNFFVPLSY